MPLKVIKWTFSKVDLEKGPDGKWYYKVLKREVFDRRAPKKAKRKKR